jgi:hypothetical protein
MNRFFDFSNFVLKKMISMRSSDDAVCDWYVVRDTLFGLSNVSEKVKKALELAAVCDHELARWLLLSLFADCPIKTNTTTTSVSLACK